MRLTTVGPTLGSTESVIRECQAAKEGLGEALRLVILYAPFGADHGPLVARLAQELGVPVVGGTTGGVAFTERGYQSNGFVVGLLGGDALNVHIGVAEDLAAGGRQPIVDALRHLRLDAAPRVSVMTFADPFTCDGELVIEAFRSLSVPHARLFGGTVGDGWRLAGTAHVFANDRMYSDAAVFAALSSDHSVDVQVLHGFRITDDARPLVITDIEGNHLKALNDEPAADVYGNELQRLGLWDGSSDFHKTAALYELGAVTPFGEGLKIRVPMSLGDNGSLILGASLRSGETLRVVSATQDQLIDAATELSRRVEHARKVPGGGSLVFDCAARWQLLGDRYEEQVRAFQGKEGGPVLGVACYGEIAKSGASIEGFHNTTAVMAGW